MRRATRTTHELPDGRRVTLIIEEPPETHDAEGASLDEATGVRPSLRLAKCVDNVRYLPAAKRSA